MDILEDNLKAAYYGVIKESKDMNPNCRGYALPSLCYSVLPICRTPEETNHQFFRNKAIAMEDMRHRHSEQILTSTTTTTTTNTAVLITTAEMMDMTTTTKPSPSTIAAAIVTSSSSRAPTSSETNWVEPDGKPKIKGHKHDKKSNKGKIKGQRSTTVRPVTSTTSTLDSNHWSETEVAVMVEPTLHYSNIVYTRSRRSMKSLAESEVLKKRYPPTRNTENLRRICRNECELLENELCQKEYAIAKRHPAIGQVLPLEDCHNLPEDTKDCSSLGIAIDVDEKERCYWENGAGYRGTVAESQSSKPCLPWARLMKEIADYPELAGQNYCR